MTDEQLRRLMRKEIKAPAATRFCQTSRGTSRESQSRSRGRWWGSAEFVFLGLPFRVSLQPPGRRTCRRWRRRRRRRTARASAGAGSGAVARDDGAHRELRRRHLESRPKRSFISNPLFFSRKLERETYAGLLSHVLGTVENVVANVFGFDVVINGDAAARREGKLKMPRSISRGSPSVTSPRSRTSWTG